MLPFENWPEEIDALFDEFAASEIAAEPAQKRLKEIVEQQGWVWMGLASKQEFNRISMKLLAAWSYAQHSAHSRQQLLDGQFPLWVFRADLDCRPEHQELDGVAVPPDHAFWHTFIPSLGWDCGCYALGARSEASALRLSGNPSKSLPAWVNNSIDDHKVQACIDRPWRERPIALQSLFAAFRDGEVDLT